MKQGRDYWKQFNSASRKPISLETAVALFDQLADRMDIDFAYAYNCHARAHLMCKDIIARGHLPQKSWAVSTPHKKLEVDLGTVNNQQWEYHTAPALDVRLPSGKVVKMVFDPSLFNGPVSETYWADSLHADRKHVRTVPLGHDAPGLSGDYYPSINNRPGTYTSASSDAAAALSMEDTLRTSSQTLRRVVLPSPYRLCAEMPQGRTWQTHEQKFTHLRGNAIIDLDLKTTKTTFEKRDFFN